MASKTPISTMLYNRLISYLHYMRQLPDGGPDNISSTVIANALNVNDVQVRKDLAIVSNKGKPKIGYITKELIADLDHFLGYDNTSEAVLVGVGNLGKALLTYKNFDEYGLKIVAAFEKDPNLIGKTVGGVQILDISKMVDLCKRLSIRIGIITVPSFTAQDICEKMTSGGIRAVWNFAPVNLKVPETVIVKNEEMAASLAILTKQLEENIAEFGLG